jgi:hypothetical protein
MAVFGKLKRLFAAGTTPADEVVFQTQAGNFDHLDHEIHREESFKVEALEPRILLSADPLTGELVRLAEEAGRYDPAFEVASVVQQIEAIALTETPVEQTQEADDDIAWPADWLAEDGDANADVDALEVAVPAMAEAEDVAAADTQITAITLALMDAGSAADTAPVLPLGFAPLSEAADKGYDAQSPPAGSADNLINNENDIAASHGAFGVYTT